MTLHCARNIQYILAVVVLLVFLPFALCFLVFGIIYHYCEKMMGVAQRVNHFFGRYLLLHSDEVRNGVIKNQDVLKYGTASMVYRLLKNEKNRNKIRKSESKNIVR